MTPDPKIIKPQGSSEPVGLALPSPYLLFLGDVTTAAYAKTAFGLRDWAGDKCIGEFALPGATVTTGLPAMTPADALKAGAKSLVIGIANEGGKIPASWIPALVEAIEIGLDIVSGMHVRLASVPAVREAAQRCGRALIDVRTPPPGIQVGSGRKRSGKRLLTVGTDCALGKKYTALAIAWALQDRGVPADFRATGQTGIMIAGSGMPMDAVVSDFLSGAAEMISPAAPADHWDIIEGQGSLYHPGFAGVSLGLLHGSQPDVFVVCHDPTRTEIVGLPGLPLPSLEELIELTLTLGHRVNPAIRCGGISLNTSALSESEAADAIADTSAAIGLPAADPLRGGPEFDRLVDSCLA
ncbi:DUF1611 domain-containing protein [Croceibacterium selenioxidans]|uniref:DUF1611 domain-containing protein n=1 Tax=Croceibacterium selenioxidans TaxID=2838833 RepID=UPI002032CA9D|nr:DUF1611 domain-containing protein [Croceibacterium selenioxidans]